MQTPHDSTSPDPVPAWLRNLLEPLKPLFKEVLAVSFFINLLAIAVPVFVLQVYDRVLFHAGLSTLQGLVIGIAVVIGFDFVLRRARARMLQAVAVKIDVEISTRLVGKLLALPLRTLESRPGSYWSMLFRDADVVRNVFSGATAVLATDLVFGILFLGIVAVIAWPVFWVLMVIFALFVALAWHAGRFVDAASEKEKLRTISRDSLISEFILGRTTVKALALGERMRDEWERRQEDSIVEGINRGTQNDLYLYAGQSLTLIATVAMTTVGALAILNQNLTMGGLIAANMLSSRLLSPMNQLVGTWRTYTAFKQSARRLVQVFAEAEDLRESPIQIERPKGRITLENVTFRYAPEAAPALEEIRLDIPAGGMTAVMGSNGGGKTTLAKVLLGLYRPDEGKVFLDGADITQFARRDLARWMGYVPQECVLFAGTIRENIAYAKPDATDDEVIRAAALARAHGLIVTLPKGYGSPVGEGGSQLPGGLRQRIAIARALLGDPPILVMDEPTASLDRAGEEELRQSLTTMAKEKTIILVTHSPPMVHACHNVVIIERGRIKTAGPTQKTLEALGATRARPHSDAAPVVRVVAGGGAEAPMSDPKAV
jgi:PrtD family type I secretion system ABC transporter